MLAHRLRRWSNIDPALGEHLVFAWQVVLWFLHVTAPPSDYH